jgi:hypothetical protein
MRSILEGRALVILTIWRGDTLNVPLHRLRRSPSPGGGGIISNYGGNYRDNCIIPEIALYYDGSGQHLLLVFASLCEIILALGFHLHERGVVCDR